MRRIATRIALAFGALLGVLLWFSRQISRAETRGRQEAEHDALKDTQQRLEKGRSAVARGRDDPPDQRVRNNDGAWD